MCAVGGEGQGGLLCGQGGAKARAQDASACACGDGMWGGGEAGWHGVTEEGLQLAGAHTSIPVRHRHLIGWPMEPRV